jgi:hypothetical protein
VSGPLYSRVKLLKEVPFEEAVRAVLGGHSLELAELPAWLRCPIHGPERTPSLIVHESYWYCHGACKTGGDALDLVQALEGLELREGVARLEQILGISADASEAALARALAEDRASPEVAQSAWSSVVEEIALEVLARARAYLASRDPFVVALAEGPVDYVLEELRAVGALPPPVVSRARRELLRDLRVWSSELLAGVERDVLRLCGRDRLDVGLISRAALIRDLRVAFEVSRPLCEARKLRERRLKQERKPRSPR